METFLALHNLPKEIQEEIITIAMYIQKIHYIKKTKKITQIKFQIQTVLSEFFQPLKKDITNILLLVFLQGIGKVTIKVD